MKFIYNHAIEFYCYLCAFIEDKIEKDKEDNNIPSDPALSDILQKVDQDISPFLKHDIELFFNKMFYTSWMIFYRIIDLEITEEEELFSYFNKLSDTEFRNIYLEGLWLQDKPVDQIQEKDIKKSIVENFFHSSRPQEKMLKQLLDNPGEWKPKILQTLTDFYHKHYLPFKEEIIKTGTKRGAAAKKEFDKDPTHYLDTLTLGHYRDLLKHAEDTTVYISYSYNRGLTLSIKRKIILLGLSRETLLTSANRKLQSNILFTALSDKKRVEILRLLGEREWFSNELAKHFGLTAATMSYHLNKLLGAGLVTIRIGDQKKIYYSLSRENLENYLDCCRADLLGDEDCSTINEE
ncbi:MAG: winged helix-turn-helix transcriptional regulator [Bacteroidetes bacterium]|nr:winged helix-turn-helix transcriptional regulator [Bacteroidota bacterium]